MRITLRRVKDRLELHCAEGAFTDFDSVHYLEDRLNHRGENVTDAYSLSCRVKRAARFGSDEHRLIIVDSDSAALFDNLETPYEALNRNSRARLAFDIDGRRVHMPVRKGANYLGFYEVE